MITAKGKISPGLCDLNGHLNVANYTVIFDQASWEFLEHLAGPVQPDGSSWADVQHTTNFMGEVDARESWRVLTRIVKIGKKSLTYRHDLLIDGENAPRARCEVITVRFDRSARKAIDIEESVRIAAQPHLE